MKQVNILPVKNIIYTVVFSAPLLIYSQSAVSNTDTDDLPALLQFAERYKNENRIERKRVSSDDKNGKQKTIKKNTLSHGECSAIRKETDSPSTSEIESENLRLKSKIKSLESSNIDSSLSPSDNLAVNTKLTLENFMKPIIKLDKSVLQPFTVFLNNYYGIERTYLLSVNDSLNKERNANKSLLKINTDLQTANEEILKNHNALEKKIGTYLELDEQNSRIKKDIEKLNKDNTDKDYKIHVLSSKLEEVKNNKSIILINKQLTSIKKELSIALEKLDNSDLSLIKKQDEIDKLNTEIKNYKSQITAEKEKVEKLDTMLSVSQREGILNLQNNYSDSLKAALKLSVDEQASANVKSSYSLGTYIGEDIVNLGHEHDNAGIHTNKSALLSGIIDAFSGEYKLPTNLRRELTDKFDDNYETAKNKKSSDLLTSSDSFLNDTSKNPAYVKSDFGFWYLTLIPGSGNDINESTEVELSVKELLSNGEVIQDMNKSGKTLTKKASDLPPLFMNAVLLTKKGGKLKIIVPPNLAYGEKGLAPKIPPNSVMIYEISIKE